ncbi:peptide deformylase [Lactiplantibacillus plantarum]|uniref:peptide deformylase n=1 Tax=Lactiplantibacillus plantarum TaxID=1590 RepID=UPI0001E58F39|nr:peptide deformylase [Lactiplantibacillus plantarum]ADN98995.1 peptide deformylase [Lactiplantibacillus plantarum ST-III]ATL79167.1 peptide deformylase [Lactiplantibacillus plantarum]MDO7839371.1 peptide deformylase [Lactiplantibacillus plantarum]MZU26630.1 peptide deformylase [Lactiplantibacillus plantarum]MZU57763.1 peptide deformylase [Lactiplantibacillus plantarum]
MIKMRDIIREGNHTLRAEAKQVNFPLSEADQKLANDMMEYLENSQDPELAKKYGLRAGVGLAAPQVDVSEQMAAVLVPSENEDDEPVFKDVIINPVIISHSVQPGALTEGEGCLSVDRDIAGYVIRHDRITLRYYNMAGEEKKIRLKNYPAIVCQHEIDHLHGILFYDHINGDNPFAADDDLVLIS